MKKTAILLLALAMLLTTFAGCSSSTESKTETAAPTQSSTAASQASTATTTPAAAPEIVIFLNNGAGTGAGSEAGSTKESIKMVQDYILEKTGIKVTTIVPSVDNRAEKLALLLAGGDQLDMWWGVWQDYSSTGIIQPINELLKKAPAINAAWDPWEAWVGVTDKDGVVWGVPRETPTTPYQVFVRQDWLKKYNLTQPTTMKELNNVLYTFKKNDPYGNGQTNPLICRNMTTLEYALVGGFVKTGAGIWVDSDGKVKPLQLAEGYKDFLAQINQWYKDGIINKENFGWDTATVREHIAKGDNGVTATWYSDVTGRESLLKESTPGASYNIYEPGIRGDNGNLIQTHTNASTQGLLLHSKSKNAEACFTFLNWCYEAWYNHAVVSSGIEGVHWKYADNADAKKNNQIEAILPAGSTTTGYFGDFNVSQGLPMDNQTKSFYKDGTRPMHAIWMAEHLDDFDAALAPVDYGIFFNTVEMGTNIPTNGDIKRTIDEELVKFVTGERPLTEYDAFIQQLYKVGLDQWITEYTRQYNELKK